MTLSLFETVLIVINVFLFTIFASYYSHTSEKIKRLQSKQQPVDGKLVTKILQDLQGRGVSLLRLETSDIFYRSPRG